MVVHLAKLHNLVIFEIFSNDDLHFLIQLFHVVSIGFEEIFDLPDERGVTVFFMFGGAFIRLRGKVEKIAV